MCIHIYGYMCTRDFVATLTSNINRFRILRIWSDVVELNNTPVRWTASVTVNLSPAWCVLPKNNKKNKSICHALHFPDVIPTPSFSKSV